MRITYYFVMKMLDDCTPPAEQQKILRGLRHLNTMAAKKYAKNFYTCSFKERTSILALIETGREVPGDVTACYEAVKKGTIQAYASSQYYLSDVLEFGDVSALEAGLLQEGATSML